MRHKGLSDTIPQKPDSGPKSAISAGPLATRPISFRQVARAHPPAQPRGVPSLARVVHHSAQRAVRSTVSTAFGKVIFVSAFSAFVGSGGTPAPFFSIFLRRLCVVRIQPAVMLREKKLAKNSRNWITAIVFGRPPNIALRASRLWSVFAC